MIQVSDSTFYQAALGSNNIILIDNLFLQHTHVHRDILCRSYVVNEQGKLVIKDPAVANSYSDCVSCCEMIFSEHPKGPHLQRQGCLISDCNCACQKNVTCDTGLGKSIHANGDDELII